jgi:hypothetical protein
MKRIAAALAAWTIVAPLFGEDVEAADRMMTRLAELLRGGCRTPKRLR